MTRVIDINCDMGESYGRWRLGDDDAVVPQISTANLACGFHASDPCTMVSTVGRAARCGVAVGAHPGLPDLLGFGRRVMDISPEDAYAYVLYQAGALDAILAAHEMRLNHMKPHGALYLMLNEREDLADAVLDATETIMARPVFYWPAGSEDGALMQSAARRGIRVVREFYPDLGYSAEGRLLIERDKRAVDPQATVARIRRVLVDREVDTQGGTMSVEVESICVHGDTPGVAELLAAVRSMLAELGIEVARPRDLAGAEASEAPR